MIIRVIVVVLAFMLLLLPLTSQRASAQEVEAEPMPESYVGEFTGKILPVFFVTDVLRSVDFYLALGFEFRHFFDYAAGEKVQEWLSDRPPIWALMSAGPQGQMEAAQAFDGNHPAASQHLARCSNRQLAGLLVR